MVDFDAHLSSLDAIDTESDAESALTDVLAAVSAFNADVSAVGDAATFASTTGRLKEWLDKLVDKMRAIVSELRDVASFSISVSAPFGVSVGVTFAKA